jgi:hypothetical protein
VTVVGYGVTSGTDDTGSGTRSSVSLSVSEVCSRIIQAGNATANACSGDSGGAVLLGGKLVAVVSGGQLDCESPTNFMRTDAHASWIAAILAANGASESGACDACVGPDPSCTAATETQPAGAGAGEDSGADAGATADAATNEHAPSNGGGGGCQLARGAPAERGPLAIVAGVFGIVSIAARRERRPRVAGRVRARA